MRWMLLGPEVYTFLAALGFLGISLAGRPNSGRDHLAALCLSGVGVLLAASALSEDAILFSEVYRVDLFSQVFKLLLSVGLFLIVCICGEVREIREENRSDFFALIFFCTLAMMLLVSGNHLLTLYLSLELSSYSLYVLVSLRRARDMGVEAGIKFFLVGIFASALMLFGMAVLYAMTRTMNLNALNGALHGMMGQPLVLLGVVLTLSGFLFKLACFPFHLWVPDVYQGAANEVTAYLAAVSKLAGMAAILRFVASVGQGGADLVQVLLVFSVASMTLGNLAAITQQDLKRLLGYSTVAHAGYVLIGVLTLSASGYASVVFYALALLVMKFTAFLVVVKVAGNGTNLHINQLAGLHRRSPVLAMALMVSLFSLAGIPPTVGFTGKFLIFVAAMEKGHFALVLIAMANVLISLYYYLLVIKAAYLLEPEGETGPIAVSAPTKVLATALVGAMVLAGFYPYPFMEIAQAAVGVLP
ncbi:MAG: NADH-quinone oxidoreductase subunit N [Deltaproteobacteria bacterium]|nr:NADH-quinone oxidoreductase subunit N [Deltaproteobacteria bacterium]